MADKMMRIAGRADDGNARAIRTDSQGNVGVQLQSVRKEVQLFKGAVSDTETFNVQADFRDFEKVAFRVYNTLGVDVEIDVLLADNVYMSLGLFPPHQIKGPNLSFERIFQPVTIPNLPFRYFIIDEGTETWETLNSTPMRNMVLRVTAKTKPTSGELTIVLLGSGIGVK